VKPFCAYPLAAGPDRAGNPDFPNMAGYALDLVAVLADAANPHYEPSAVDRVHKLVAKIND